MYDDLHPTALPNDITLFNVDEEKYPLMDQTKDHIQHVEIEKGDCLYVPSLYWMQSKTISSEAMMMTFVYETSSKLSDLLFTAIEAGILDEAE